jgi:hypothetical protein
MNKYIIILFAFIGSFANAQEYDFQELCLACVAQNGFFCGDDPANWTQYSPNGCVPNGEGGLFYLNDGWEDCADGSDEAEAVPTVIGDCGPIGPPPGCDTVFVETIEYQTLFDTIYNTVYETIIEYDTIVEIDYIYQTDTIFVYDPAYCDTLYIETLITDTVIEVQYEEIVEYIDCDSGLPCSSGIIEVVDKSLQNNVIYNINGQAIKVRQGLYIENGKIYYNE